LDFCLFVSTAPEPAPIVSSIVDGKGLIWARAIEVAAHIDTDPVNAAALKAQPQMSAFRGKAAVPSWSISGKTGTAFGLEESFKRLEK
jgi:hypothetical protein